MSGFVLTALSLTGSDVPPARIEFGDSLNVISGPSDTGKTFIVQCLDFAFGSSRTPKPIPEAQQYDAVILEVQKRDEERIYRLERSLRGGSAKLTSKGIEERTLSERHRTGNDDTISGFLLELAGLDDRLVRKNARGETEGLSFRRLAPLIIVDEESVISERSPILSGQYTTKTVEINVFRLLLTGVDDSSVVVAHEPEAEMARVEGERELLEKLLISLKERLSDLGVEDDIAAIENRFARLNDSYERYSSELSAEQRAIAELEEERRTAWTELRTVDSRLAVLSELSERFALLRSQYDSDLRRLRSIAEAGGLLGQLKEERCPVCGAPSEYHNAEHAGEPVDAVQIVAACQAEAVKVETLLADLASTSEETSQEIRELEEQRDSIRNRLRDAAREIDEVLKPRTTEAAEFLAQSRQARDICIKALELHARIHELQELLEEDETGEDEQTTTTFKTSIGSDEAHEFCKEIESLLLEWEFPDVESVAFSEADQDIMISGRKRNSHGKGVRAIFHAAFNIGLLRYCIDKNLPHPGFVVIDSPLVVYREPDADEHGFALDVKNAFYRSLAAHRQQGQVIIVENEEPPDDVDDRAQVVRFTGSSHGRQGFVPKPANGVS